jgi:hypothetical protein
MAGAKDVDPKFKIPKSLGACADLLKQIQQQRSDAQKVVDALEAKEKALKEHLINTLPKSEASGVSGKIARVYVDTEDIPQIENWDLFWKYVKRTGDDDLVQRRLSTAAVKLRLESKKKIPGIKLFTVTKVHVNKI